MKRILAWLLGACIVLSLTACNRPKNDFADNSSTPTITVTTPITVPTATPTMKSTSAPTVAPTEAATTAPTTISPSTTPLCRRKVTDGLTESFAEVRNRIGTPETANVKLDIPVYYEFELLAGSYGTMFDLGFDACWYSPFATSQNLASQILANYPTNAIRVREDGSSYLIYDTETGYRFYLFIDSDAMSRTVGFPVLVKKSNMLSYSDFKDIQINDSIIKVEMVDDVTIWHETRMLSRAQDGYLVSSIHYLKDGILKIDYSISETEELLVSNISFNKDFKIKTLDGKLTSHKIKDIDLPVS